MKAAKSFRIVGILLLTLVLVLASGCGNAATEDQEKQPNSEQKTEETQNDVSIKADRAMLETANTNRQSDRNQMAFDDEYIYFMAKYDYYRCHYDGSGVEKLDKDLEDAVFAEGKLWGYWDTTTTSGWTGGLYSMDPKTGTMTEVISSPSSDYRITSILVSGNWMCYAGERGTALIVRNLTTGEEKTISHSTPIGGNLSDISMCIYGNTLYALINTDAREYKCSLCSYELGSDAEAMTELCKGLTLGAVTTPIWMEEGLLLLDFTSGSQYYYAKFADIEDGSWNYRKDDANKFGTDMYASDAIQGVSYWINSPTNANYAVGNDLVNIGASVVEYHAGFDFTDRQLFVDGDYRSEGPSGCHGLHDGNLYIFLTKKDSAETEILKISEGGNVEHIPVVLP